jgi:acyl-CoA thioesterase-1
MIVGRGAWPAITHAGLLALAMCGRGDAPGESALDMSGLDEPPARETIVFLGGDITIGRGIDPYEAYPLLIRRRLEAEGWPHVLINAAVSGETSAGALERIDLIAQHPIDVLVLELGWQDELADVPIEQTFRHLQAIIHRARAAHPLARILLLEARPPRTAANPLFDDLYRELASSNGLPLVRDIFFDSHRHEGFFLPDNPLLPSPDGQRIIARKVWQVLKENR